MAPMTTMTMATTTAASIGENQRTSGRLIAKLHHLAQAHAGGRELCIVADGVHELLGRLPRHGGRAGWGAATRQRGEERRTATAEERKGERGVKASVRRSSLGRTQRKPAREEGVAGEGAGSCVLVQLV